jgi:hypothetical protein
MFGRWIVPAVIGAVVAVEAEIAAATGGAFIFPCFFRRLQLGFVVKDVEGHERG